MLNVSTPPHPITVSLPALPLNVSSPAPPIRILPASEPISKNLKAKYFYLGITKRNRKIKEKTKFNLKYRLLKQQIK